MDRRSVRVLGADETGLIKVIDFAGTAVASRRLGLQSAGQGVSHMTWCGTPTTGGPEGQVPWRPITVPLIMFPCVCV
jgi:hypothetical protein